MNEELRTREEFRQRFDQAANDDDSWMMGFLIEKAQESGYGDLVREFQAQKIRMETENE